MLKKEQAFVAWLAIGCVIFVAGNIYHTIIEGDHEDRVGYVMAAMLWPFGVALALVAFPLVVICWWLPRLVLRLIASKTRATSRSPESPTAEGPFRGGACDRCGRPRE